MTKIVNTIDIFQYSLISYDNLENGNTTYQYKDNVINNCLYAIYMLIYIAIYYYLIII